MDFKLTLSIFLTLMMSSASSAWAAREPAAIDRSLSAIVRPSKVFYQKTYTVISPDLLASFKQIKESSQTINPSDFVPLDMQPTQNMETIAIQIADQSLNYLWNQSQAQNSVLANNINSIEKSMHQDLVIKQNHTEHKLSLSFDAFQAVAHLKYSGLIKAAVRYAAKDSSVALESSTKIAQNKDLFLTQHITAKDQTSELAVRWTF